ncbi:MAG: glycosyltransferase family 2 protein [Bacteriovoracaceae bacterium]|nr:glycosyltransferase [Bacteroidota bacterium]
MDPLVSLITICKNSQATIQRTIESVAAQSYENIQYIIIDAVSTDRTLEIIETFRPHFGARLIVISEPDEGVYDAMNKGIRNSSGEIIGIINSDDWYETNSLQLIVEAYRLNSGGVYYGFLRCYSGGDEVMVKSVSPKYLHTEHVGHPAYFVSRLLYERLGMFNVHYRFASDYELMLRFIKNEVPFYQINHIVANYSFGGLSSRQEKYTYEEYYKIRHAYGYLSKKGLWMRIIRNRLYFMLRDLPLLRK